MKFFMTLLLVAIALGATSAGLIGGGGWSPGLVSSYGGWNNGWSGGLSGYEGWNRGWNGGWNNGWNGGWNSGWSGGW